MIARFGRLDVLVNNAQQVVPTAPVEAFDVRRHRRDGPVRAVRDVRLQVVDQMIASFALRRFGDGERDVGGLVVFLASDDGSYLKGGTFDVDAARSCVPEAAPGR